MKLFERVNMTSNYVQSYARSGRFYDGDETAPVDDGAIVVVGDLEPHEVYPNTKDLNVFKLTAPKAVTDRVCIVDYVGVQQAEINSVVYRVGDKTYGFPAPAGTVVRYRVPDIYDQFFLGEDNFTNEPTVGEYATVTAGNTVLTPATAPVAGQFCIKIEMQQNVITGMVNNGVKYLCTVVSVAQ